jgi:hypothetical protein
LVLKLGADCPRRLISLNYSVNIRRIVGNANLWITEYTITYQGKPAFTVSIMEFRNGKVVHETQYFSEPFEAPAWRSQWVQEMK